MCGFGMGTVFQVAIFVIVVLAVFAILAKLMPGWNVFGGPYGDIIRIVIGAAVAIVVLYMLWRLAECAGVFHASAKLYLPVVGARA